MATIADDVSYLHNILLANGVENMVDQEMVQALLELYAADSQRVDLVLIELQGMLGQQFQVGTASSQLQRWEELRSPKEFMEEIQIEFTKKGDDNNNLEVVYMREINHDTVQSINSPAGMKKSNLVAPKTSSFSSTPSTSKLYYWDQATVAITNKDKTNSNIPAVSNAVSQDPAALTNKKQEKAMKRSYQSIQSQHFPHVNNEINSAIKFAKADNQKTFIIEPTQSGHPSQIPPLLHSISFDDSKETVQEKTLKYHQSILNHAPSLHVKFAAFKAAEIALSNDCFQVSELLSQWAKNNLLLKAHQPWDLPETASAEHRQLCQYVFDKHLSEQLQFIVLAVPDADPEYLGDIVRQYQGDRERIRKFISELIELKTYPSRAEYNKRKAYDELANKFFSVEEFLEMYEDPIKHFSDKSKVTDLGYRDEAINQLKTDFRFGSVVHIKQVFQRHNFHYFPTFDELNRCQDFSQRKTKRSLHECLRIKTKNLLLIEEIAFARIAPTIKTYLETKKKLHDDAIVAARTCGTLMECPICCEDELIEEDFVQCSSSHQICHKCVRRQSEELIGLMKNHICCLMQDCSVEYSLATLKQVLGKSVYNRLEKRCQAEEILAAGIEGLESCPFCEYCEVPRDSDRLFKCQNPECGKVSCRHCREMNHLPLRCEEHSIKMKMRNYVETKMTDALLRECPTCKRRFIKSDGCNKMTCVCGTKMCYVCRKVITDYNHFAQQGELKPDEAARKKCPLYIDTVKLHEIEVARSATRAHQDLKSKNPNIRIDLVLADK